MNSGRAWVVSKARGCSSTPRRRLGAGRRRWSDGSCETAFRRLGEAESNKPATTAHDKRCTLHAQTPRAAVVSVRAAPVLRWRRFASRQRGEFHDPAFGGSGSFLWPWSLCASCGNVIPSPPAVRETGIAGRRRTISPTRSATPPVAVASPPAATPPAVACRNAALPDQARRADRAGAWDDRLRGVGGVPLGHLADGVPAMAGEGLSVRLAVCLRRVLG